MLLGFLITREYVSSKNAPEGYMGYYTGRIINSIILARYVDAIIFSFSKNYHTAKEFENLKNKLDDNQSSTAILKNDIEVENMVVIIGESAQRNFMHTYGYFLNNTPFTQNLLKSNLFIFKDVISPDYGTASSLQKVLTFSSYENESIPWYKYGNLVDMMKTAGYFTMWLSNQENISGLGNVIPAISSRSHFRFYTHTLLDEKLLSLYDKHSHLLDSKKKLFVFHLMGSHPKYLNRYPSDFAKFSSKDILDGIRSGAALRANNRDIYKNRHKNIDNKQAQVTSEYVNTHYYTDFILSKIIEKFQDKESIIIYFSDHSQDIIKRAVVQGIRLIPLMP